MKENLNLMDHKEKELKLNSFKRFFLLEFTKELIRSSQPAEIFKLENILEQEKKSIPKSEETREKIKEIIQTKEKELSIISKEKKIQEIKSPLSVLEKRKIPHMNPFKELKLIIPETKFPMHIQYIKPVPMEKEIDLGNNLNPFIKDPLVQIIECYGSGHNLLVKGGMGVKKTGIVLTKEEIEDVVRRFSEETKIPASEGIYKVVAGRLIFLAIISDVIGSKFIIKKMLHENAPVPHR